MPRQVWFSTPAALAARFLRAELAFGRLFLTVSPALVSIVAATFARTATPAFVGEEHAIELPFYVNVMTLASIAGVAVAVRLIAQRSELLPGLFISTFVFHAVCTLAFTAVVTKLQQTLLIDKLNNNTPLYLSIHLSEFAGGAACYAQQRPLRTRWTAIVAYLALRTLQGGFIYTRAGAEYFEMWIRLQWAPLVVSMVGGFLVASAAWESGVFACGPLAEALDEVDPAQPAGKRQNQMLRQMVANLNEELYHLKRRLLDEERQHDTPTAAQA